MNSFLKPSQFINCKGKLMTFDTPKIMGILNVTPDSFFDGGRYSNQTKIIKRCQEMIEHGADIIDIGAYSSRPDSVHISTEEELQRLRPALSTLQSHFKDLVISVDTFRAEVAKEVVEKYGVSIINDISGGTMDDKMFATVAQLKVPYILMHLKGTPQTMQQNAVYQDLTSEIMQFFAQQLEQLKSIGVNDIILDLGFGFGKTLEHNYELFSRMEEFKIFERLILVGISRKSMIYKLLGSSPEEALNGTTILNTIALQKGVSILRVHDVKEAVEVVKIHTQMSH